MDTDMDMGKGPSSSTWWWGESYIYLSMGLLPQIPTASGMAANSLAERPMVRP